MESYCCKRSNSSKQGLVRRKYSSSGRVNWVFQLSVFQSNVIRPSGYLPYLHRRVSSNYSCHQKSRGGRVGRNKSKERDRKSELVLGSTYQIFECDRNNSDRNFEFWETNRIAADRIF